MNIKGNRMGKARVFTALALVLGACAAPARPTPIPTGTETPTPSATPRPTLTDETWRDELAAGTNRAQPDCVRLSAEPAVTLALLGDLMVGRGVNPTPASLAYLAPYLQAADLSMANLESPLTPNPPRPTAKSGYDLCAPASRAALFPLWGLDMLTLANNHRFDCRGTSVGDTARAVAGAGLVPVGPGEQPVYQEVNGIKLAFAAFDDVLSPIDAAAAAQLIREARASGAVVIVSVHWGVEYQHSPTDRQQDLARQFAGAGAALIVGTHPHVLQRAEWIQASSYAAGAQSRRLPRTLVLYSLGNALFDQTRLPDTRQSALVIVTLDQQGVSSVGMVPFALNVNENRLLAPDEETAEFMRQQLALP